MVLLKYVPSNKKGGGGGRGFSKEKNMHFMNPSSQKKKNVFKKCFSKIITVTL